MKNKKDLTFTEVVKILGKSRKTISRYIRKGLIKPETIKSKRGTIEYRFNQAEIKSLKPGIGKTGPGKTRQPIRQDTEVIGLLRNQLIVKDKQIKSLGNKIDQLIERSREANILINGLANRVLMLEDKKREDRPDKTGQDIRQDTGQRIRGFFKRIFKGS